MRNLKRAKAMSTDRRNFLIKIFNLFRFSIFSGVLTSFLRFTGNSHHQTEPREILLSDLKETGAILHDDLILIIEDREVRQIFSRRCTHLGCRIQSDAAGEAFECPCHGSRFDLDGRVTRGPAKSNLPALNFHKEKENLVIES